jgi:hypothetical protein
VSYFHKARAVRNGIILLLSGVILIGVSACRSSAPIATPTISPSEAPPATPSIATEAVVATSTPEPLSLLAQVVLIVPPGADAAKAAALQETLADLAAQDGLSFETTADLSDVQFTPETRLVVTLPPDPGVANLAAANPEVQFLMLGASDVQVAPNLSVIGADGERLDQQGFLAGYLAAVITRDWRVGAISRPDSAAEKAARNGFANGVVFFCGLCRPAFPPFIQYPILADLSGGADWQVAVDTLRTNAVKTVYVTPGAAEAALFDALAQAGMQIVGVGAPPPQAAAQWVASLAMEEMGAVRQLWPRLLAGEGGFNLPTPLSLGERNAALFSLGRQRLVDKLLTDLLAGYVDSGVDPQTGERR